MIKAYFGLAFIFTLMFFANLAWTGGAVVIEGGTFTIHQIHGDPIEVAKFYSEDNNPGLIFYVQKNGQEGFVNTSNIANPGEMIGLLKSDGSAESSEKYMAIGREQDRIRKETAARERKTKEEALEAQRQTAKQYQPAVLKNQTIETRCHQEWKDDYRMVEYCIKTQREALGNLNKYSGPILERCKREWGDDYRMVEYCTKEQIEAKQRLGF